MASWSDHPDAAPERSLGRRYGRARGVAWLDAVSAARSDGQSPLAKVETCNPSDSMPMIPFHMRTNTQADKILAEVSAVFARAERESFARARLVPLSPGRNRPAIINRRISGTKER